jgi:ABC-type sugar transport systems, permease components
LKKETKAILAVLPAAAVIFFLFVIPMLISVERSLTTTGGEYIGLSGYEAMFNNPKFTDAFFYTLEISLFSTVLAVIAALGVAMALRQTFVGKKLSLFLFQMNASIPHLSVAAMMLFLLLPLGFISGLSAQLGLIGSPFEFPLLVRSKSGVGVILSFAWKFAPFIGLSVLSVLQAAAPEYEEQAATLGVGPFRRFVYILLPMIKPALVASFIICFAFAFGSYEVPLILGESDTLAKLSFDIFNMPFMDHRKPEAYAISNLITLVTLVMSVIYFRIITPKRRVSK